MNFPVKILSVNENDTAELAGKFADQLSGGEIVTFEGDLGAGKTFFIKNVVKHYGINSASSPSFAIVNEYYGKFNIYHFDFYRIKKLVELYDIGIDEYLSDPDAVKMIEWAELFPEVFELVNFKVIFKRLDSDRREITIERVEY